MNAQLSKVSGENQQYRCLFAERQILESQLPMTTGRISLLESRWPTSFAEFQFDF